MADNREEGGLAGVCHLLPSLKGLTFLRGASEGLQAAGLVVWLSKDAVDLGLAAAQAVGVAKARWWRAVWQLRVKWLCRDWQSCWDVWQWGDRSSSGSPWWMIFAGSSLSFSRVGWATSTLLCLCLFAQNLAQGGTTVVICSHESG